MIVVTGAAGLIGCAVVRELNRRGIADLLLVDHLATTDKWTNLRTLGYDHYMEKEDFIEKVIEALEIHDPYLDTIDTIIHLGACSSTTENDASYLIKNNYEYSRLLAEFAVRNQIRMVYASSAATYGDGSKGYEDDENKMETLLPLNPYGYSKQMFDLWLKKRNFRPSFAGIKYFNVFGPNEYHKGDMMSVVLKSFRQIQSEGRIRLFRSYRPEYADGEQKRDFLYVEDAAWMTVFLALDRRDCCGVFNSGRGRAETWLALANAVFAAMEREPIIEFIDMPEYIRERYQYYTCAPMDKLLACGYNRPFTSLEDGVRDYVQNYLLPGEIRA